MKMFTGAAMAMMVAGVVGCNSSLHANSTAGSIPATSTTVNLVHCYGVNACNGHNDCKTANNACAGKASCKGHGFVTMPSKACMDVGGKVNDRWVGTQPAADLVKCNNVNICGGHNDCKTANNACAGKGSCRGTGYVFMNDKACADVGGMADKS